MLTPELPYRPRDPQGYSPGIGLIGCGAITKDHLTAYRAAGYSVVALCDIDEEAARKRQHEFYPDAAVVTDFEELLGRDDVEVVDVATHPPVRVPQVEAALRAGKHVLSQKPFCLDLAVGERLVELAVKEGRKLAVNQNGRFAPHWSWIRHAIAAGLLGEVESVDLLVHWDHDWVVGTAFDDTEHLLLLDFGIHWFDIAMCFLGQEATRVQASVQRSATQRSKQPLLGQASVELERGRATLVFNGSAKCHTVDTTIVAGATGAAHASGPDLNDQSVRLATAAQDFFPTLEGQWFPDGMHGAMAELLSAIAEDREPSHGARENLASLAVCFAACASAQSGEPQRPGAVTRLA